MLVGTCSNQNFSHLCISKQLRHTFEDWYKGYHEVKLFKASTHKQFKNEQVPKSSWKNKDRKGANTFPFYNLPPVLRISRKKIFSVLFPFPWLDEIKVGSDSCLPRHLRTKNANQKNSQFCHRITELATLLGKYNKVGFTLGFRSFLIFFFGLSCLIYF